MKKLLLLFLLLVPAQAQAARLFVASNSDRISIPAPTVPTANFSFSVWVYPVSQPGATAHVHYSNGNSGGKRFIFYYENFGGFYNLVTYWQDESGVVSAGTKHLGAALTLNVWTHILWVITDAGTSSINRTVYVNGVGGGMDTVTNTGDALPNNGGVTRIGCETIIAANNNFTDGRMAEEAVWNVALTAAEALALARGVRADRLRATPPALYYPLEGWQDPEPDYGAAKTKSTTITGTTRADGPPVLPR